MTEPTDSTDSSDIALYALGAAATAPVVERAVQACKQQTAEQPENSTREMSWRCAVLMLEDVATECASREATRTRVAIASTNQFVRDALQHIVAADPRYHVVETTGAPAGDLANLASAEIDVLVIEITGGGGGHTIADLDSLVEALPGVHVVVLPSPRAPQLEHLRTLANGALIETSAPDATAIRAAVGSAAAPA
jgi:hypothetical protein